MTIVSFKFVNLRNTLLTIILLFSAVASMAQGGVVTGRVVDSKTLEPLPYSTVYISNTTIGGYADDKGEFKLQRIPSGPQEIIVTRTGYQLYHGKIVVLDSGNIVLPIKLIGQVLREVVVTSKKDQIWKDQLKRFKLQFFGTGKLALQCKIINPWVLDFKDAAGVFTAEASQPLNIENLALGYNMAYQLKKFSIGPSNYTISGYIWFQQIETIDTTLQKLWFERRKEAYLGSSRHLFNAILADKVVEEGFDLYQDKSGLPDVVRQPNFLTNINNSIVPFEMTGKVHSRSLKNENIIQLPSRLEAHYLPRSVPATIYRNVPAPISWIEVKGGTLHVNDDGIALNPQIMIIYGAMGDKRVTEALPYDYKPPSSKKEHFVPQKLKLGKLSALVEKTYLHTDRSYYYPEEVLWFKAYINYFARAYSDSLSKVLYVDLIGPKEKVIGTRICQIDSTASAVGDIALSNVEPGDYEIRAYTRWNLNFEKELVFTKPIKVIHLNEIAVEKTNSPDTTQNAPGSYGLKISADAEQFKPGQVIELSLAAYNPYNFQIPADISVSVCDVRSAVEIDNEKTIISDFNIPEKFLEIDTFSRRPPYSIQVGIDIKGQFMPSRKKKQKPKQGILTFVNENSKDNFRITTEMDGTFFIPNLQLYDTADIAVEPLVLKGKKQGYVIIDSTKIVAPMRPIESLSLNLVRSEIPYKPSDITNYASARILNEVVVKDTKIKRVESSGTHLFADASISGDDLRSSGNGDLASTLQSRIPGLRIVTYFDNNTSSVRKIFKLGGAISLSADFNEPLVLLDKLILNTDIQTAAEQVSAIPLSQIERVEILKYGSGAAYGTRGAYGVIAIFTNGLVVQNIRETALKYNKEKLQKIKTFGYSTVRQFQPAVYSGSETNDRRYHSTIYWNPTLHIGPKELSKISFSVPFKNGRYKVTIEGVTGDGRPVRATKVIVVGASD